MGPSLFSDGRERVRAHGGRSQRGFNGAVAVQRRKDRVLAQTPPPMSHASMGPSLFSDGRVRQSLAAGKVYQEASMGPSLFSDGRKALADVQKAGA